MSKSPAIQATLEELLNSAPALARVLAVKVNEQLRYHAIKLAKLVESHSKHYTTRNQELIDEYEGVARPQTGAERAKGIVTYDFPPANLKAFADKKKELLAVMVTIPWGPITRAMVEPYEEITGEICMGLGPLFELEPPTDATE